MLRRGPRPPRGYPREVPGLARAWHASPEELIAPENGHNKNPTPDTFWRYTAALSRRMVLAAEAIADTRAASVRLGKGNGKPRRHR